MLAKKITDARNAKKEIIHKKQLKPLSSIARQVVADNYLLFKELKGLSKVEKEKVYNLLSVDYKIEDTFPQIDYEPFWEKACRKHFKSDDCALNGNSWKQCYAENYIKKKIAEFNFSENKENEIDELKNIFSLTRYYIFNLDIPTFSFTFDISLIPKYFSNLTSLTLKYSPILRDKTVTDIFSKELKPIGDEYYEFGMRVPDLKKFCIYITELNYFLSLTLQGNLVDDEMIKWLVPGLITNQTLRYLDLSSNKISEKGVINLASYLIRTKSLLSLDLSNNLIGGEAAFAIGLVIKENTRLKILKLGMNRIDDINGARIVKMIARNTYLEELDLSANDLGEQVISTTNDALKYNNNIKSINFSYSKVQIEDETIKICENHPNIVFFEVRHTHTKEEDIIQLESILTKKKVIIDIEKNR